MAQANDTLLHRWFEQVWNQGREAAIDEMLAEDGVVHGLADHPDAVLRGPAAFKPFFHALRAEFSNIRIDIEEALAQGDMVAARCRVSVTHSGAGRLSAATGRTVRFAGMCFVRVKDGKIAEGWNNFDFLGLYQQLGMELK